MITPSDCASVLSQCVTKLVAIKKHQALALIKFCKLGSSGWAVLLQSPSHYVVRSTRVNCTLYKTKSLQKNIKEEMIITGKVVQIFLPKTKKIPCTVKLLEQSGNEVEVVLFNYRSVSLLKQMFRIGKSYAISGQIRYYLGKEQIVCPSKIVEAKNTNDPKKLIDHISPVYGTGKSVSQYTVKCVIKKLLCYLTKNIDEWIDQEILACFDWLDYSSSLRKIHFPKDMQEVELARKRLAFDELLARCIINKKLINISSNGRSVQIAQKEKLFNSLEFKLTPGQIKAVSEIEMDQAKDIRMMRVLQGDVGCGKTIVAIIASLNALESGLQVCFMAPTEFLAEQHFETIKKLLHRYDFKIKLLTGSSSPKEKSLIKCAILSGEIQVIVGTHAILSDSVLFHDLGMIIIDEQHKFGILQRINLVQKSKNADVLLMSATPIPATLAAVIYEGLPCSSIHDKPKSREVTKTIVLHESKLNQLLERVKVKLSEPSKIYWVCPSISENKMDLSNVQMRFEHLVKLFPDQVLMLHGNLKKQEQDLTIRRFLSQTSGILVTTTMIEVGIDVPSASIIVIENAERFGLAQLHQLRGRVGRGSKQSFCALIYKNKNLTKKLQVMKQYTDGFMISEMDMHSRGKGDLLLRRQSGFHDFVFFDPSQDLQILKYVSKQVAANHALKRYDTLLNMFSYLEV